MNRLLPFFSGLLLCVLPLCPLVATPILSRDHVANHAELIVNGRVLSIHEMLLDAKGDGVSAPFLIGQAEIEVLAILKGSGLRKGERIKFSFPIRPNDQRLGKGDRYTFLLSRQEGGYALPTHYPLLYSAIPLSKEQPNDALLLLDYDLTIIAREFYEQHPSAASYAVTAIEPDGKGYRISFYAHSSRFHAEEPESSGQVYLNQSGVVQTAWIASGAVSRKVKETDVGEFVRLIRRLDSEKGTTASHFGTVRKMDDLYLHGEFFTVEQGSRSERLLRSDIIGIQPLTLRPEPLPAAGFFSRYEPAKEAVPTPTPQPDAADETP